MNNYSASYDVDMAKKYGLEAAALYNKLVYLSRYTAREDGFCWKTAKELEDELGITKRQQERAVKILEEAGLIETKVTYISGTLNRCKHFRVMGVGNEESALSESNKMSLSIESNKMSLSESNKTSLSLGNNQTVIINSNNTISVKEADSEFSELWKMYPRKVGKGNAFKAYFKARKEGVSKETVKAGIIRYNEYIRANEVKPNYIKHGSTWFNQQCWDDDYGNSQSQEQPLDPELEKYHIVCEAIE